MPSVSAGGDCGKGLFSREMGPLQDQLCHGEYDLLKCAPMLESDFVQVCLKMIFDCQRFISKRGEMIDVHNQIQTVTVAVACTSPSLLVSEIYKYEKVVYIPCSLSSSPSCRLFPLCLVRISIHNPEKLRFKLASGRTFYLQLCPQPGTQEDIFSLWVKVVNMLQSPSGVRHKISQQSQT
ncbi:hypothetical protein NXF25_020303 [Crotalus adamanteus]|uniref:Golgi associated RAB2 interactor protein-like Rab2B-binding domain-containing protein n=1 Tax=Crotalus adamanteus TaxID=8729 RepID=A0AAW1B630_CROAD